MDRKIYVVYQGYVVKKDDSFREREYKAFRAKHPDAKIDTKEKYESFLKSWGECGYFVSLHPVAYFTEKEEAIKAVITNRTDINESGSYPYAVIKGVPEGAMYPDSYIERKDIIAYEYNRENDSYVSITGKIAELLKREAHGFFGPGDSEEA